MFRNHRSRWTVAMVVVVLLVSALPAAAGPAAKARKPEAGWEKLVIQVISWLGSPWKGGPIPSSTDTSSYIDPNGQH